MAVCRCTVCGHSQTTRSKFELDCEECGGALVPEDAYDPEPEQLRCGSCGYVTDGAGTGADDEDYSGGLTVEDRCPRCQKYSLVPWSGGGRKAATTSGGGVLTGPETGLARAVARKIRDEHWDGTLPVDVAAIAESHGVQVEFGDFNHQGRLEGGVIKIPNSESRVAQRFGIAHELGHHELRHQVNEDQIEPEANAFASELLVPTAMLKKMVGDGVTMQELRVRFYVSREVIVYALDKAGLLGKVKSD